MPTPNIPLHLTLTGRPLLLYPNVIPEMMGHLQSAYTERGSRLANRLMRRKGKKSANPTPLAARAPSGRVALSGPSVVQRRDPYIEVISISGPLLNKAEYFENILCVDGYDRIEAQMSAAVHDPDCQGVFLDIDSPGGMVSGCFELHDKIAEMAKIKPIIAFSSGMICSSAYAIAAACTEIHGQMSAIIGSVGVVYGRLDATAWNENNGLQIDFIKSGEQKVWGNPETKMDDVELASHQSEVMKLAGWFFDRVSAARGITTEAVSNLEAGVFLTDSAIESGLADSVTDYAGAFARLTELTQTTTTQDPIPAPAPEAAAANVASAKSSTTPEKEKPMSKLTNARHRASLAVTLSAVAFAMVGNMSADTDLNADELEAAIEEETKEVVDAMSDDDVQAMDEEDTEAMEDDDDIEAMDEDELKKAEDEDDLPPAEALKATASSIAHKAAVKTRAVSASAPAASASSDDAVTAERSRVAAIMALPEAKGRESLAQTLATSSQGYSVDAAKELLAASPKKSARTFSPQTPKVGAGSAKPKVSAGQSLIDAAKAIAAK